MKLLVSALEPSANLHLRTLLTHLADAELSGVFDRSLGSPIIGSDQFSAMGFLDIVPKIMLAKKTISKMVEISKEHDTLLLIDAPAFNITLAKAVKKANPHIRIIYYILPKVWAWKKGRIATVERYTDVQAYIFPFEKLFWTNGIYVGNPILDLIQNSKQADTQSHITAFLPGSRKSEIKALMPIFRETANMLNGKKTLVIPSFFSQEQISDIYGDTNGFELRFDTRDALAEAEKAVVCSGTATLEAALVGTPFVLVYKAKAVDAWLARKFVKLRFVGLANILLDFESMQQLHEELLQEDASPNEIVAALQRAAGDRFTRSAEGLRELLMHGAAQKMSNLLQNK